MSVTIVYPTGHESTVTLTNDAYAEGSRAWFHESDIRECPYPIPGRRAAAWLEGWHDAEREFEAAGMELGEPVG